MVKNCFLILVASFYLQIVTKIWSFPLQRNPEYGLIRSQVSNRDGNEIRRHKRSKSRSTTIFLYTRHTGKFVKVTADEITALALNKNDKYAKLILTINPDKSFSQAHVSIKGKQSNKFICMDQAGHVVLKDVFKSPECTFFHIIHQSGYGTFRSVYNPKWHLGFKKRGTVKKGHHTKHHHHAAWLILKYF